MSLEMKPTYGATDLPSVNTKEEPKSNNNKGHAIWVFAAMIMLVSGGAALSDSFSRGVASPNDSSARVAGDVLHRATATITHLKTGSNGAQHPTLLLVVKSGSYPDEPGVGYAAIDPKRFAEPHRITTFTVTAPSQAIVECTWSAANSNPREAGGPWDDTVGVESAGTFTRSGKTTSFGGAPGHAFEVTFPSPGTWTVSATCYLADGSKATIENEAIGVYYVRRELRELTVADKELFLDTFVTLYKTPTAEGVTKYGKQYRSLTALSAMHLRGAAIERNVDHMHDGLGFLTQHVAMTMEFELAMQSVAPRVAVPYWDYTIDSAKVQTLYPDAYFTSINEIFKHSELFREDWFGSSDHTTGHVEEGRMAQIRVPRDYNFEVRSSRGFLRAPWNINPSAKVTRYHSLCGADEISGDGASLVWPTCATHLKMVTSSTYETWYAWSWQAGYTPHGTVHSWVGGVGGGSCDEAFSAFVTKGYMPASLLVQFKINSFTRLKTGWRDEVLEVPMYCSEDAPVSECMWTCVKDIESNTEAVALMEMSGIYESEVGTENFSKIAKISFCEVPYWPGDHFEAASPVEASFWPIHPAMERLLMMRELSNPFTDKTWLPSSNDTACTKTTSGCKGHNAYDVTVFKSTVKTSTNATFKTVHLTNEEVRSAMLPSSDAFTLPYVYNHFKWAHCDALGQTFPIVV